MKFRTDEKKYHNLKKRTRLQLKKIKDEVQFY